MKIFFHLLYGLMLLVSVYPAAASVLLSDNFDNNVIDTSQWSTNTSLTDPYGTPSIAAINQRCEITARAYLNTVADFDPSLPGGIAVSGTWTIVNSGAQDLPAVVTRCSGVPTSYYAYAGEPTEGVQFHLAVQSPAGFTIYGSGNAVVTSLNIVSNTLNLAQGDSVNFFITDDGTNLSCYMTKVGDSSQGIYATAVCTNHLALNKISFYNREYSSDTAAVDNIVIQTIPPTSPKLNIAASGNQSVLFWPASGTNYILQSTTDLSSTNWTTVTDAAPVIAFTVTNQSPARFFRLVQQQ